MDWFEAKYTYNHGIQVVKLTCYIRYALNVYVICFLPFEVSCHIWGNYRESLK